MLRCRACQRLPPRRRIQAALEVSASGIKRTKAAKPTVTTDYRLATTAVAAAPIRITVAPRIRFYADKTPGHLRGLVRPVLAGAPVEVQSQDTGGVWTTVAAATVDANGDFDATLQLATGTYRARIAATKGFAAGTTPTLSVVTARR